MNTARPSFAWPATTLPTLRASTFLLLAGLACAGCAVEVPAEDEEEVAWDDAALSDEAASLVDAELALNGVPSGLATEVVIDEEGLTHVTILAGEAPALLEHALHELAGEATLATLRVRGAEAGSGGVREVELTECLMKEVHFSPLKADDGKGLLKVTFTFAASDVKYSNGSGSPIAAAPARPVQWSLEVPSLPAEGLTGFSLTARRMPTKNYAAWEVEGLKLEGDSAGGAESAEALAAAGELVEVTLRLTDESSGATTSVSAAGTASKFTTAAENKGGEDKPLQWKLEMLCEEQRLKIKQ